MGGKVLTKNDIAEVKRIADKYKLQMHLDGARILNAASYLDIDPADLVSDFDSVNFCLSKGLGCPFGSLVVGKQVDISHAKILRKLLGGDMKQSGIFAVCGLEAL